MKDFLNARNYDKMMYNLTTRAGGSMLNMYSYELLSKSSEPERPKYMNSTWLLPYSTINKDPVVSRISKESFNALVYTIQVTKTDVEEEYKFKVENKDLEDKLEILFGQHYSSFKNLDLFSTHNYEIDIALTGSTNLNTSLHTLSNNLFILKKEDYWQEFLLRNKRQTSFDFYIPSLDLEEKFFIGYNSLIKTRPEYQISDLEVIKSVDYIKVSDNCFNWIELQNNGRLEPTARLDKTLLLDYKIELNTYNLKAWFIETFSSRFEDIIQDLDSDTLEIHLIFHPPLNTSMQFINTHSIVSPASGLNYKIEDEVVIRIPKSMITNSQKYLVLNFKFLQDEYIYTSIDNATLFTLIDSKGNTTFQPLKFENSIFESLSNLEFESNYFRVKFKIPSEVINQILIDKKYNLGVVLADLTSISLEQ